jgi:hypothetical protein
MYTLKTILSIILFTIFLKIPPPKSEYKAIALFNYRIIRSNCQFTPKKFKKIFHIYLYKYDQFSIVEYKKHQLPQKICRYFFHKQGERLVSHGACILIDLNKTCGYIFNSDISRIINPVIADIKEYYKNEKIN